MNDRTLRIARNTALCLCLGLAAVLAARYLVPRPASAAHGASNPESYVIPVTEINLDRDDGQHVVAWQGSQDVDLASATSLADIASFRGSIPAGRYTRIQIFCGPASGTMIKVKGSVTVNGTTYYTKASHTNYATGPAELEDFPSTQLVEGYYSLSQTFSPPIVISDSSAASLHALVDISDALVYYDGTGTNPLNSAWGPGMYLQRSSDAITVGMPGYKEVYDLTDDSSPGKGRLTLLYDNSGAIVGCNAREVLSDGGTGIDIFPTWAPVSPVLRMAPDSTYELTLYFSGNGQVNAADSLMLSGFQHATCSGTYARNSPMGLRTGTYTATLIPGTGPAAAGFARAAAAPGGAPTARAAGLHPARARSDVTRR